MDVFLISQHYRNNEILYILIPPYPLSYIFPSISLSPHPSPYHPSSPFSISLSPTLSSIPFLTLFLYILYSLPPFSLPCSFLALTLYFVLTPCLSLSIFFHCYFSIFLAPFYYFSLPLPILDFSLFYFSPPFLYLHFCLLFISSLFLSLSLSLFPIFARSTFLFLSYSSSLSLHSLSLYILLIYINPRSNDINNKSLKFYKP